MDRYLSAAREEIEAAVRGRGADVLAGGIEGKWSIAEILEHLALAFTANRFALEKALASGELRARRPRLKQWLGRILVVDLGYVPRVTAPDATVPKGTIPPDQSVAAVCDALTALDATLSRVAARFGDRVRVANHMYLGGLTVQQWRKFHWRHARHHMGQVKRSLIPDPSSLVVNSQTAVTDAGPRTRTADRAAADQGSQPASRPADDELADIIPRGRGADEPRHDRRQAG